MTTTTCNSADRLEQTKCLILSNSITSGCKFYPVGENRRFERVAENLPVGSEIFKLEAHPRSEFRIEPVDNSLSDVNYFKFVDIDDRFVAIKLNQTLEDLVDRVSSN